MTDGMKKTLGFGIAAMLLIVAVAVFWPSKMPDKVCKAQAEEIADKTTKKAQDSASYGMERLGKMEDAYNACMKARR